MGGLFLDWSLPPGGDHDDFSSVYGSCHPSLYNVIPYSGNVAIHPENRFCKQLHLVATSGVKNTESVQKIMIQPEIVCHLFSRSYVSFQAYCEFNIHKSN